MPKQNHEQFNFKNIPAIETSKPFKFNKVFIEDYLA
jgi:hypothetical protein